MTRLDASRQIIRFSEVDHSDGSTTHQCNDLCQKLRLVGDHRDIFGTSVETRLDLIHLQEVWYPC